MTTNLIGEEGATFKRPQDGLYAQKYINKIRGSESRGIEFTLTFTEFKRLYTTKRCKYTKMEFCDESPTNGVVHQFARTLDRVDPSKGYTKENTVACCHWVNQFKSFWEHRMTTTEVIKLLLTIQKNGLK